MPEFEKSRPVSESGTGYERKPVKKRKKKQNIFISIVSGLLPWKGDSIGNIVRKFIFLLSLGLIVYAAFSLIHFYLVRDIELQMELDKWELMKEKYTGEDMITINMAADENDSGTESDEQKEVEIIGEYLEYYNINNDFVGYVEIHPIIKYVVAQTTDNDFYLKHNFEKVPTENGTIFADFEVPFTSTTRPNNTIIYGHNLITKHFFQPLKYFRENMDYLVDHPTIKFDTLYERGTYKIFSVFLTNSLEQHGEVFDYWNNITFKNKEHFDNFVAECLDRSYYYTGVDLQYGDELLMLSTCDFSMFSDMRLVVAARRVRENEIPTVDTSKFIDNSGRDENGQVKRKMFKVYYETFAPDGWAGRKWDPNYIKDFKG